MQYIFSQDGDYVNFNGGGNLWRLHKNSRCVAWHWDETGDLFFDVYDLQFSVKAEHIGNVVIGGVTLTTAADFETNIVIVFPGLAGGGSSPGSSYLSYVAVVSQSGISAPVATVLENTLGGVVVWSRQGTGDYRGTLAGIFTIGKTIACPFGFVTNGALLPVSYNTKGYYQVSPQNNTDWFGLFTCVDLDYNAVDLSTIGATILIEIRVYP